MGPVMLAWMVEVGIISVRDFVAVKRPPLPSELLASFVVFGGLGILSESSTLRGPVNATAWGIVVATLLSSKVDFLKPVGDFFAGTAGTGPGANQQAASTLQPGFSGTPGVAKGDAGNILRGVTG